MDGFSGEFHKTSRKGIMSILYSPSQKREAVGIVPNSFYEANITLMQKPDKALQERRAIDR